ncbi:MAG: DUF5752 family protein [Chloroflexota bacterium]
MTWLTWLEDNWLIVTLPVLLFLACYVVGLWLRIVIYGQLGGWAARSKWKGSGILVETTRRPFLHWFILLGIYIAVWVSILPVEGKGIAGRVIGSLFVLSFGRVLIVLTTRLLQHYLGSIRAPQPIIITAVNIARVTIIIEAILITLDIWGVPTTPILLLLAAGLLAAGLALRDAMPNLFAGSQLVWGSQIKLGDFIRLEMGETGYVTNISWRYTQVRTPDGTLVLIPNSKLVQTTVVNYGRPLRKAKSPFRFSSRTQLTELTGLKARNLEELVNVLKKVPDAVIYYHTHHFLEEHHYLTPEPSNDFALWVSDALGDEVLGERLASVDTFGFPALGALRDRVVAIIEEHQATAKHDHREAMPGREFHFLKSVSAVFPTPYLAHDLRELVEALRQVSLGSLYFHIFESRLRLGRGMNDFSIWLKDSLEEAELADEIGRLDPYTYTLGGLRSALIPLIEKRIK